MKLYKEYSIFIWLFLAAILAISTFGIYTNNRIIKSDQINSISNNIYLKKIFKEIANNLEPRFSTFKYSSKAGDTYENIINKLKINKDDRRLILNTILKEKSLKVLGINQKFFFKFDNLESKKITEFTVQTDKKNEIQFTKALDKVGYISKKVTKNLQEKWQPVLEHPDLPKIFLKQNLLRKTTKKNLYTKKRL